MESNSFEGKTILISGATSGIGNAVCSKLSRLGASLIVLARNQKKLDLLFSCLPQTKLLPLEVDLEVLDKISSTIETAINWHGCIDGFVHCAGQGGHVRLRDTTPDFFQRVMRVNCMSFVEIVRALVTHKKRDSLLRIVALSSLASQGRDKYLTAYAASKAALEAATKTLSVEMVKRKIIINCIAPAFVKTPSVNREDLLGNFSSRLEESGYQPLGLIAPEEVAYMTAYLLSGSAAHMTGLVIPINAGVPC